MAFVKITKNTAYFRRFQTKFRRRREAKTDYQARKGLVMQDLNKFLTPKYRLVVRITNSKVIAQIAYSTYEGDRVFTQADSRELAKWGLSTGFTSYSAAYATGLLLARRTLTTLKMGDTYKGAQAIDGKDYDVSAHADESRRPFTAVLDIGLRRPTVGNRVFAAMKGACDGGLSVPHSTRKFPGFSQGEKDKKGTYDSEAHKNRIFGAHIDEYMETLKENPEALKKQFSLWIESLKAANVESVESVEELFKKVFEGVRADPMRAKTEKGEQKVEYKDEARTVIASKKAASGTYTRQRRLTAEERKARLAAKVQKAKQILGK